MLCSPIHRLFLKIFNNTISTICTLACVILIFTGIVSVIVPPILQQANNLTKIDYETVLAGLQEPMSNWETWLVDKGILDSPEEQKPQESIEEANKITNYSVVNLQSALQNNTDSLTNYPELALIINVNNLEPTIEEPEAETKEGILDEVKKKMLSFLNPSKIQNLISSILGFGTNFVVTCMSVLFVAFFFLKENGLFKKILSSFLPDTYETQAVKAVEDSKELLVRYFFGVFIQVLLITLLLALVLKVLSIESALLIAFFAALMNVIPYMGPILGAGFGMLVVLTTHIGGSFYQDILPDLIKILCVFMGMQMLDNFVIQPNIFSKSVKAHPLEIFIVILMGAKIGGILGMVVAIPVYTVLRVLAKVFLSEFKVVQALTKEV